MNTVGIRSGPEKVHQANRAFHLFRLFIICDFSLILKEVGLEQSWDKKSRAELILKVKNCDLNSKSSYLYNIQESNGNYHSNHRHKQKMVVRTQSLVERYEKSDEEITKNKLRLKPRIIAISNIPNNLGNHNQILSNDEPLIETEKVY